MVFKGTDSQGVTFVSCGALVKPRITFKTDLLFSKEDGCQEWWGLLVAWHS